jgi:hypothetical protein
MGRTSRHLFIGKNTSGPTPIQRPYIGSTATVTGAMVMPNDDVVPVPLVLPYYGMIYGKPAWRSETGGGTITDFWVQWFEEDGGWLFVSFFNGDGATWSNATAAADPNGLVLTASTPSTSGTATIAITLA